MTARIEEVKELSQLVEALTEEKRQAEAMREKEMSKVKAEIEELRADLGEREVLIEAINSDLEATQAKLRDAVNEAQELNKENENLKKYVNKAEELHVVMENLNKEKAQLIAGF